MLGDLSALHMVTAGSSEPLESRGDPQSDQSGSGDQRSHGEGQG